MSKYKRKRVMIATIAVLTCNLFVGCSLIPEEKTRPTLIVQKTEKIDYEVETVIVEDIVRSKFIYCTYTQMNEENLSFQLQGKEVKKLYVTVGEYVKKGDILAELDLGADGDSMNQLQYEIEKLNIRLNTLHTKKKIEKDRQIELHKKDLIETTVYNTSLNEIEEKYKSEQIALEDDLFLKELKMEEFKELEEKSKLYAGIDGVISSLDPKIVGKVPKENEKIIHIIDTSNCAFRVETEYAEYFKEGEIVQVEMKLDGGTIYEAKVVHDQDNKEVVYFQLLEPSFTLSVGDRGTITLILDEKKNALSISSRALRRAEDFNYVYYINDEGIRSMKEVTVGIYGNNSVEITEGLVAGDIVITR